MRRITGSPVSSTPGGLRPWREIITPQSDVASGNYKTAEFAADLGRVHQGEGSEKIVNAVLHLLAQ